MKKGKRNLLMALALTLAGGYSTVDAQSQLYPQLFNLNEVTLGEGPMRKAMLLNDSILLEYDVDRLLTPYCRQAGIAGWESAHPNFSNWGSGSFRLDGHVGGHYLTALALAYAANDDAAIKAKMLERLNYMVDKMDECQRKFDDDSTGLYGYIGGLPDNTVWTKMYAGDVSGFNSNRGNVPLYVQHKIFAGLRDAYVYAGSEKALECFKKLCDWGINLISNLTDTQVQSILDTEHGGMNEVYADAYRLTGDERYQTAAKRYSHLTMVNGMQSLSTTFLDSKHANTQVPKYVGFARASQEEALMDGGDASVVEKYLKAVRNFWTDVTSNRTVCIGGNSVDEHFLAAANSSNYITNPNGPESCNTNNMLKLTERLFEGDHSARYAEFYERALFNHILSTQNPTTGGYVYFTSLRPQHYRMYSQVNQAMWCCVGTGMENHSKYGEFIYARSVEGADTLFVNLFIDSKLNSEKYQLTQQTKWPYEQSSTLTIGKGGSFALSVRCPQWADGFKLTVNGEDAGLTYEAGSYATISRTWSEGDVVVVSLPMKISVEECPNYTDYAALKYGPILLGAKTSTENLAGQFAGEGRMDHCPSQGSQLSLTSAPMLIGERETVADSVYSVDADNLIFKIRPGLYSSDRWSDLTLQPFYTVHEARYMVYWNQLTAERWAEIRAQVEYEEQLAQELSDRTIDYVSTGEQQSDAGHGRIGDYGTGTYDGEYYIDAKSGKWFSYELTTNGETENISLMCRYTAADKGRVCTIYIDEEKFQEVTLSPSSSSGFFNVEYPIDSKMLLKEDGTPKEMITVKFVASGSTATPGLYYLRLLRNYQPMKAYTYIPVWWGVGDANRVNSVSYGDNSTIHVNGKSGTNNICLAMNTAYSDICYVTKEQNYLLVAGRGLSTKATDSYLWWLNGCNKGSQVKATYSVADGDTTYVLWDIPSSGIDDYMKTDTIMVSANGKSYATCFGLTSTRADWSADISDLGFYSPQQAVDTYPALSDALGIVSAISEVGVGKANGNVVYNLSGMRINKADALRKAGVYVVDGRKHVVK